MKNKFIIALGIAFIALVAGGILYISASDREVKRQGSIQGEIDFWEKLSKEANN